MDRTIDDIKKASILHDYLIYCYATIFSISILDIRIRAGATTYSFSDTFLNERLPLDEKLYCIDKKGHKYSEGAVISGPMKNTIIIIYLIPIYISCHYHSNTMLHYQR